MFVRSPVLISKHYFFYKNIMLLLLLRKGELTISINIYYYVFYIIYTFIYIYFIYILYIYIFYKHFIIWDKPLEMHHLIFKGVLCMCIYIYIYIYIYILQSWPKISAPLVNMIKKAVKNYLHC